MPRVRSLRRVSARVISLVAFASLARAQQDSLIFTVQPGKAVAGEAFEQQPRVQLLDSSGAAKKVSSGYAIVFIDNSPSGFSQIFPPADQLYMSHPTFAATPGYVRFPFVEGIALMSGLRIDDTGEGFVLRVESNEHAVQAWSAPFDVALGKAYQLQLSVQPGTANGGHEFAPQPTATIQDKGGNIVTTQNSGTVTVRIESNPVAATLSAPAGGYTLTFNQGMAPFQSLSIDRAGSPFSLTFVTDLQLDGSSSITSFPFTVGIGPAHSLRFMVPPSGMRGGAAFAKQPQIEVLDKGGNRLEENSVDKIRVFIQNNPSGGTIAPFENRLVQLVRGIATFHNLRIDKTGNDYTLRFYLLANVRGTQTWKMTDLYVDSPTFDVVLGEPQRLVVSRAPRNAWAGGSPIGVQPVLDLQDLGGNVIQTDSVSSVQASLASSLRVTSTIVVNTNNAPQTAVTAVTSTKAAGIYGVGETIDIAVEFNQEVTVTASAIGNVPALVLATGSTETQSLCITTGQQTRKLIFRYVVQTGHASADLNYARATGLVSLGATVIDGNNQAASLALPALGAASSLASQSSIVIDTSVPKILRVSCQTPGDGRYGAGELVDVLVEFSEYLAVTGVPRLQMVLDATTASVVRYANFQKIIGSCSGGNAAIGGDDCAKKLNEATCIAAACTGGTGVGCSGYRDTKCTWAYSKTLVFQYVVQPGDAAIVLGHVTTAIDLNGGTIRRQATTPTMNADISLATLSGNWLQNTGNLEIVTVAPKVDDVVGITVQRAGGTYSAGDVLYIDIPFTEPVAVVGIPRLLLETNPSASASDTPADYMGIGSGTKVLRFKYEMRLTDSTADLDVHSDAALTLNGGQVKRYVSRGTAVTDADLSLVAVRAAGKSLSGNMLQPGNANFVVDGSIASVSDIGFVMTPCASTGTYTCTQKGDVIDLKVKFTSPVVVDATSGTPSIELETSDVDREAAYFSGSGTNELIFRYVVMLGDDSHIAGLDYLSQTSLSVKNKYELDADAEGYIRRASDNPVSGSANLVLPLPSFALSDSAFGIFKVVTGMAGTKVTSVTSTHKAGTYGVNEVIPITIYFNDEVFTPISRPVLFLNSGTERYAKFESGYNQNYIRLMYIVQPGDTSASLDFATSGLPTGVNPLACTATPPLATTAEVVGGPIKNLGMMVGQSNPTPIIDCSLAGLQLQPTGIQIDTTAPKVVTVRSPTPTNSMHNGVYVVGDVITIIVTFNLEVDVREKPELAPDKTPLLLLQTGNAPFATLFLMSYNRKARYVGQGPNGGHEAKFEYVVQPGDYSANLRYVATDSMDLNSGQATIKRMSTTPTTDADLTLPDPTSVAGTLAAAGQVIAINGDVRRDANDSFIPRVINVASSKVAGVYGGGERVFIDVTFDLEVIVNCYRNAANQCTRQPFLQLELGAVDRKAMWDPDLATGEAAGARVLTFLYTAQGGDFSYDLDYVDRNSLQLGLGTILMAATNPTTVANLTLPAVGAVGSLAYNNAIQIDGLTPYVIRVHSDTSNDCQQWLAGICIGGYKEVNDVVDVVVTFSAPVAVIVDTVVHGLVGSATYNDALPRLIMFLGLDPKFHREALYVAGHGTASLTFRYTVETGDETTDLDYVGSQSIVLKPNTQIRRLSEAPVVDANLWLNPPGGKIYGTQTRICEVGRVSYRDLLVDKRGKGYAMYWSTNAGGGLYTSASFDVIYSSEYEVMAADKSRGDLFGAAASVHSSTAVIGSPFNHQPVREVQTITTSATATEFVQEIQLVRLSAQHRNEVQTFESFASPGEALGGTFTITFGTLGPTRALPYDIHPSSLKTYLNLDIPEMGRISVARAANTYCACTGAYLWTVTFEELQGALPIITIQSALTGAGATLPAQATVITPSTKLGGTFQLSAGHLPIKTTTLTHEATPMQVMKGITDDLGVKVWNVDRSGTPDAQDGYTWTITFVSDVTQSDVPQLIGSKTGLTGHGAGVRTWTARDGRAPLAGTFRLQFRADSISGSTTADIPYDASASLMKSRLEALPSITEVDVTRGNPTAESGYTWSITFKRVKKQTKYGIQKEQIEGTERVDDIFGNLPGLVPLTSRRLNSQPPPLCQSLDPHKCPPSPGPPSKGHSDPSASAPTPAPMGPTPAPTPVVAASASGFEAGEELADITDNMLVYKNGPRNWRMGTNDVPTGTFSADGSSKYIRPARYPVGGACSTTKGFSGGGAGFNITTPHTARICCGNYHGERQTVGFVADGSSATSNLYSYAHKGPRGKGWSQIPGEYGITNHVSVPASSGWTAPCTWYHTTLLAGTHSVCCDGTWGTGVVLTPYKPEPEPFSPCAPQFHDSCTPTEESATQHPFHLKVAGILPLLEGSDAQVTVDSVISGSTSPFWEAQRAADMGRKAGAAYVFTKTGEEWSQQQKLVAADTDSHDRLGASVSIRGDVVAAGAPGAESYDVDPNMYLMPGTSDLRYFEGVYEQQEITCTATSGYFKLLFRGAESPQIKYDATAVDLHLALESTRTIHSVIIRPFDGPLCKAANAGAAHVTFVAPDGNFEPLVPVLRLAPADGNTITLLNGGGDGSVSVTTITQGERRRVERGAASGAAYMFRRNTTTFTWAQEAKLLPETPSIASDFGWSVATDGTITVVGAPGEDSGAGAVYIFKYDAAIKRWKRAQRLTTDLHSSTSHSGPNNPGQDWKWVKGGRFGHSVALSGNTIVAGQVGVDDSRGAVYVIKRVPNKDFQFFQRLHAPALQSGDGFGWSVAIDGHTVVAGAYRSDTGGVDAGVAMTFQRADENAFFYLQQTLKASDAHRGDQFGRAVAISQNTAIVSAHEEFGGALTPRAEVQSIITSALSTIGGYFRVGYRRFKDNSVWEHRITRSIQHDVQPSVLKQYLEADLETQELLVTRTSADAQGGYMWMITFVGVGTSAPVPQLDAESDEEYPLTGTAAEVTTSTVTPAMKRLRGNAYVFTRESEEGAWTEQAALVPKAKQYTELVGFAASIDHETALVGCPNRDTYVSEINGGAGYFFDLGFLNLAFSQQHYSVTEGDTLNVKINRCRDAARTCHTGNPNSKLEEIVNFDTGDFVSTDRHNQLALTKLLNFGYAELNQLVMPDGSGYFYPSVQTWLDPKQVSTAIERAQSYGGPERRSVFVNTQYDFRGISDYDPASGELSFAPDVGALSFSFKTTDDSLVEAPDEVAMIRLSLPGVLPSYGGRLWSTVTLLDDGDGMSTSPLRAYTSKLYAADDGPPEQWPSDMVAGSQFGYAVAVDASRGFAVAGAPEKLTLIGGAPKRTGAAYVYTYGSGVWSHQFTLQPPSGPIENSNFGAAVDVDGHLGNDVRVLVGAPGNSSAFVYVRKLVQGTMQWANETVFTAAGVNLAEYHFGQRNAVAMHGDYAVIGAPGYEAIFVYERNATSGIWSSARQFRSSDYDYDRILGVEKLHRPGFGCSVDISWRTIVVGAERAEYGNTGETQSGSGTLSVETFDTGGVSPDYFGRGKVYMFYSIPQAQTITLTNDPIADELKAGQWFISMTTRIVTASTALLEYDAKATEVKSKIMALSNVDAVTVTRTGDKRNGFVWSITFDSETEQLPEMQVSWNGYGCPACVPFSTIISPAEKQMSVDRIADVGEWSERWTVQAPDRNPDDRFGADVALSDHQLVVGAWGSSALTSTTWDFETGDLLGWRKTGDAFDFQPTYGDNSIARSVYDGMEESYDARDSSGNRGNPNDGTWDRGVGLDFESYGAGQSARLQGRYYIGTFEKRPGRGHINTMSAAGYNEARFPGHHNADNFNDPSEYPPGSVQGDTPQGTLTSQPFAFNGTAIRFRVGGGCNAGGEYWNPVVEHIEGGVYIELLVDGLSVVKTTGRCSEAMRQARWDVTQYAGRTGQIRIVDASSSSWGHINIDDIRFDWDVVPERTPNAGAAYAFRRTIANSEEPCTGSTSYWPHAHLCQFSLQAKLQASDKRAGDQFGYAVDVDDGIGGIVVGAKHQVALDHNKMPLAGRANTGENSQRQVGAVYFYTRIPEQRGGTGNLIAPPLWPSYERARLESVDPDPRDFFGGSVALSGFVLFAGAVGDDGKGIDGGAVYQQHIEFVQLQFRQKVFPVLENNVDKRVEVVVMRTGDTSQPMLVTYSTSDITALGVDKQTFDSCLLLPISERGGTQCGDYELTTGDLVLNAGLSSKSFFVRVMDNGCYEHAMESFKVQLSVPGGNAILGEHYAATVRIDDDDFTADPCL